MAEPEELTFAAVRTANVSRAARWHPGFPGVHNWTGGDWSNAMMGEVGELAEVVDALAVGLTIKLVGAAGNAANTVKKLRRSEENLVGKLDKPPAELLEKLAFEAADVFLYLDLLLAYYGITMGPGLVEKFNQVSELQDFPERLAVVSRGPGPPGE